VVDALHVLLRREPLAPRFAVVGEEEAYNLELDPRELDSRPADAPPELREIVFRELESAERHELTEEEEATVAKRLADLGYL